MIRWWLLKIYVITVYLYSNVSANDNILPTDDTYHDAESLSKCIVKIGGQGNVINPTIYVIKNENTQKTDDAKLFMNTMIEAFAHESVPIIIHSVLDFKPVYRIGEGNLIAIYTVNKCQLVLKVRDDDDLVAIKYLFLFDKKLSKDCINEIENHNKFAQEHDVTFIYKDGIKNKYNFLTFMPLRNEDTCNGSTSVHINTCDAGCLERATVFPQKSIKNLGRCPINMMFYQHAPFAYVSGIRIPPSSDYIKVTNATGSDVEIMKILAQSLNANPVFYLMRSQVNIVPYLISNDIHVFGGGTSILISNGRLDVTDLYGAYDTPWIFVALRETRCWENFIANIPGIYFFLLLYVCYSFAWKAITYFDGHAVALKETFLYGWGALVGATSLQPARSLKQKILNITFMIMCIHFSTYFSTQLYSFLVIQKPPEMFRNYDEIMNSGRNIYLRPGTTTFLKQINIVNLPGNKYSCGNIRDCANKVLEFNGVTLLPEAEFYAAQVETAVQDEPRLLRLPQDFHSRYVQFVLGYRNLANYQIKKITNALFETGITRKLYMDAIGMNVIAKSKIATQKATTNDYSCESGCSINLPQIAPVFCVWLVGSAFSCFVFFVELLWNSIALSYTGGNLFQTSLSLM